MDTILVGENGSVETFTPPLLNTLERCLCRLVNDASSTPKDITNGLWYVASIVENMGQPTMVVKNPYGG